MSCACCATGPRSGSAHQPPKQRTGEQICPTCGGEGGWQDDYEEDGIERDGMLHPRECPDCFGYGTLDAKALQTMLLELRAEVVELQ